jgi:hypothetical protein
MRRNEISTDSTFHDETKSFPLKLPRLHFWNFPVNFPNGKIFTILSNLLSILMTRYRIHHSLFKVVIGNAALLINRSQISPENYTTAWKKLVTEYDDKRALIHAHIYSFTSLSKGKSESAIELKKLRDIVSIALTALSNLPSASRIIS